ncbi:IS110 family transposase [Mesorhizobium sp. NPDC059054]|uniref:IS110 family transposase n=1 Tax=Mesorhizobium sp. NPDC059054 TaxID=3346711 RepID=UPI0036AE45D3
MIEQNYIGCDISKRTLDFHDAASGRDVRIANDAAAIAAHVAGLHSGRDFIVMEATGVHDRLLRHALAEAGIAFSRHNPTHTHHHAKAGRQRAKTDRLDARMLCDYGRCHQPAAEATPCAERERLQALVRRRDQLVDIRADQKKHLQEAFDADVTTDIESLIITLDERIKALEALIRTVTDADATIAADYDILVSAPGVATVTATTLIALMPELGQRSPKTIAALAGLAPIANESGSKTFRSHIRGGRPRVRRALYMAALTAIRSCQRFTQAYTAIATRSGSKKLAIIAVARKLLVSLNAMIRDKSRFA